MTKQIQTVEELVKEIMQAGFDVSMGGNPEKSEEWNKLWGEKEYDLLVAEYTNKINALTAQAQQEAVDRERERCYQIAISTKSVIGRSPLAEEIAAKIKSGEALQTKGQDAK